MKNLFSIICLISIFNGCSSIIHQYDSEKVSIGEYKEEKMLEGFSIGTFQYIPRVKMTQNEFLIIGILSDEKRKISTNIPTIVKNEINKYSKKYLLNKISDQCVLNGEIYTISWDSISGDTKSIINYIVKKHQQEISKIEIEYNWRQGLFSIVSIPQKLSFSIHGNFNELLSNSNFKEVITENCQ